MEFQQLKELGLTEGEIKVYTGLLQLGLSTKGLIVSQARVSESKVYEILNRLKEKGLVSFVEKKKGKKSIMHFKAANPSLLNDFLDKKREEINKEEQLLKRIMPSLQAQLQSTETEYSAVIYEGFKGIQANNKEVLELMTKKDEWIGFGVTSSKSKEYNLFWVNWLKQRAKKGGFGRILFVDKGSWYYNELKKIPNTQIGYFKGIAPAAVTMVKTRVMIFTYGDHPACLAITNKEVFKSFKGFFESMWALAEKEKIPT